MGKLASFIKRGEFSQIDFGDKNPKLQIIENKG